MCPRVAWVVAGDGTYETHGTYVCVHDPHTSHESHKSHVSHSLSLEREHDLVQLRESLHEFDDAEHGQHREDHREQGPEDLGDELHGGMEQDERQSQGGHAEQGDDNGAGFKVPRQGVRNRLLSRLRA
jgi:hypothetical protein